MWEPGGDAAKRVTLASALSTTDTNSSPRRRLSGLDLQLQPGTADSKGPLDLRAAYLRDQVRGPESSGAHQIRLRSGPVEARAEELRAVGQERRTGDARGVDGHHRLRPRSPRIPSHDVTVIAHRHRQIGIVGGERHPLNLREWGAHSGRDDAGPQVDEVDLPRNLEPRTPRSSPSRSWRRSILSCGRPHGRECAAWRHRVGPSPDRSRARREPWFVRSSPITVPGPMPARRMRRPVAMSQRSTQVG